MVGKTCSYRRSESRLSIALSLLASGVFGEESILVLDHSCTPLPGVTFDSLLLLSSQPSLPSVQDEQQGIGGKRAPCRWHNR
jgi:hypothetical protein